jgi:hypothetical protein
VWNCCKTPWMIVSWVSDVSKVVQRGRSHDPDQLALVLARVQELTIRGVTELGGVSSSVYETLDCAARCRSVAWLCSRWRCWWQRIPRPRLFSALEVLCNP